MQKRHKKNGFSLLELLVVVSIMGILIAMGSAAFSTAQKKSRDGRRKSDMKAMQSALEQYYAVNNAYPVSVNNFPGLGSLIGTAILPAGSPVDPKSDTTYFYSSHSGDTAYCICARLENTAGNATDRESSTSCIYGTGNYYYCLSNLQ